ncbi:methyl-accepting chemotaxis protein [Nocardioides pakistanensis]
MKRLNAMSIQARLVVIVVLFGLGMTMLALVASSQMQSRIMAERQAATRSVVETALGVVTHYGEQAAGGALTEEQAKAAALTAVKQLRYSGEEYFWINDMHPTMVMHPMKPELDGTDLTENADPDGKHLFVEFVKVVQAEGAGFVDYQWPKPGAEEPQPKVSYVAGYEPWGWVIGSGVYVDDVRSVVLGETMKLLLSGLGVLVLVGGASFLVGRTIVRPIRSATDVLASGDLDTRLPEGNGRTELEKLATALNGTLDRSAAVAADVRAAIGELDAATHRLVETSDEITDSAARTAEQTAAASTTAHEVSNGIDNVASGTHEMGASIGEIAQNAHAVAKIAGEAVEIADATNRAVAELGESSAQIGSVVKVITTIAEQTNLLALNATIEAARAGDAGKGFAVVAGEVKDLAQETAQATGDISAQVEAIQGAVAQAANEIVRIREIIGRINDFQATIAGAVEEQTATTSAMAASLAQAVDGGRHIATALEGVDESSRRTTAELEDIRAAARGLADTSRRLQEAVQAG